MKQEQIRMIDAPDLVEKVQVAAWRITGTNSVFLDEQVARYSACTHRPCNDCGEPAAKGWTVCESCRWKNRVARYNELPREPWDGKSMLYSDVADTYFNNFDDIADHCSEADCTVADLMLQHCKPNYARIIEFDWFADDMWEDAEWDDLPVDIREAADALNKVIDAKSTPLSWSPDKRAAIVPELGVE